MALSQESTNKSSNVERIKSFTSETTEAMKKKTQEIVTKAKISLNKETAPAQFVDSQLRSYQCSIPNREFWEKKQVYEHLKKQISQLNTSLSGYLKSYTALNSFNQTFGRKVNDAFPSSHFYFKDCEKISNIH
jgi:prophage DNA circulation protein